jgi:nitric oxide reductase NorQ protein
MKGMKPSTRQRFVSLRFDFPGEAREQAVLRGETGCDEMTAKRLVSIGGALRALKDVDLEEVASTRLLVYAAILIRDGMDPVEACRASLVESLTDDIEVAAALMEVVLATFGR